MKKEVEEKLIRDAGVLLNDESFKRALSLRAHSYGYSFLNAVLILSQRPFATTVAGFHRWKDLGRTVKSGERGITILAPIKKKEVKKVKKVDEDGIEEEVEVTEEVLMGFKLAQVFDLSQTEGKDIAAPANVEDNALLKLPAEVLKEVLVEHSPIPVVFLGHQMSRSGAFYPDPDVAKCRIEINADNSIAMQVKSLAHQLTHFFHYSATAGKETPKRDEAEVIAESVAYMFMDKYGFDTSQYSVPYVALWANGNVEKIRKNLVLIDKLFDKVDALVQMPAPDSDTHLYEPVV
jgi:hypothetical protein